MLSQLSEHGTESVLTQYLFFRVGMEVPSLSDKPPLEHVQNMVMCQDFEMSLLYRCAVDAQQCQNRALSQAILAMVLEKQRNESPDMNLVLPALLRCLIKFSKAEIDRDSELPLRHLQTLGEQFSLAAEMVSSKNLAVARGFSPLELDWFSKNAHNFVLSGLSTWPTEIVMQMLKCIKKV